MPHNVTSLAFKYTFIRMRLENSYSQLASWAIFIALIGMLSFSSTAIASDHYPSKRNYLTAGAISSSLEPEIISDTFSLSDTNDQGWQLSLGRRFGNRWACEISYIDAGTATVSSSASAGAVQDVFVDYTAAAVNLFGYLKPHASSLNAFARAGVGVLDTQAHSEAGDIESDQLHSTQFVFGAGVEWAANSVFRLRLAHDFYDQDASWTGLSFIADLGAARGKKPSLTQNDNNSITLVSTDDTTNPPLIAQALTRAEGDCRPIKTQLHFSSNSYDLADNEDAQLIVLNQALRKYQNWHVTVIGHTDAKGPQQYNLALSQYRVDAAITRVLEINDTAHSWQWTTRAVGELGPVASNNSVVGRAKNRRVELNFECRE